MTSRPNKFLDARSLEEWMGEYNPFTWEEWSLEYSHIMDLWDWLDQEEPYILDEFKKAYKKGKNHDNRDDTRK